MVFPTLCKYEWEGQLQKVMKIRLLITTEVIEEKFWGMLECLKGTAERFS